MGKGRRLVPALAVVSLSAGVIILVAGALWMAGSASGERAKFSSLEIAPRDADVFVALNTDPTSPQWLAVIDSLDTVKAKDPIRRAIDKALAEVNLDWEEDILPIAGDEGFFSVPDVSDAGGDQGYVAAFRLRNADTAQEVVDSLRKRAEDEGQEFETEEYEGVTIHTLVEPDLDGDPSTESDCKVDDEGTLLCDGTAPIPEDLSITCVELAIQGTTVSEAPSECIPFYECPEYGFEPAAANDQDLDSNGRPDSCEEAERIKREREESIELAEPYQDCADPEDLSDPKCADVSALVGSGGAVAVFEDVLAIGAAADDVKAVIDVVEGRAPSAEENERLQEFRQGQEEDFLMWGYADLAPVWDLAEAAIPTDVTLDQDPVEAPASAPPPEPRNGFRIPSFEADYRIGNGTLLVTERITVDFGETAARGFDRDIPTRMMYDFVYDVRATIGSLTATRDGQTETFEATAIGDYQRVSIGDASVALTGEHVYELQYTVQGTIVNVDEDDRTSLGRSYDIVWDATGRNWGVPIEHATGSVTISGESFLSFNCSVGAEPLPGVVIGCSTSQEGIQTERFTSDGPVQPGDGMAFFASVPGPSGIPDPELIPNNRLPFETDSPQEDFPFAFDSAEVIEELRGTYDRVGFSVSSTGDGFALDLRVLHAQGFEPKYAIAPTKAFDSHFADSVPADTMFFFAGYDLYGQNWVPLRDALKDLKLPDGATLDDFVQQFGEQTGLDLEKDILSLLTGEYAVAGDVTNFANTPEFEFMAMVDVADAARAQESLDKLGDYLESENAVEIDKDQGLQRWRIAGSNAEVVGVTVKGDAVIAGYPDSTVEDAVAGFDEPLSATSDWKRTMALLPSDTTSVGFVSASRILDEARKVENAERSFEEATDGELRLEDLTPIRSVGYATTALEGGFGARFVVLITD
jgi:Protein of unknown function (DUF3352)/Predicted membrane protein (DUF2207)